MKHSLQALTVIALLTPAVRSETVDGAIPVAKEPEFYGLDADIPFVDQPDYTDANATWDMDFQTLEERQLLIGGVIIGFLIASAAAPIVASLIESRKKNCQQLG